MGFVLPKKGSAIGLSLQGSFKVFKFNLMQYKLFLEYKSRKYVLQTFHIFLINKTLKLKGVPLKYKL